MKSVYKDLTQSKFYSSAFNTAIFDGPIRFYFSQFHEGYALKVYFQIQEELGELLNQYRDQSLQNQGSVLILMYPSEESFLLSFEGHHSESWEVETWQNNLMVGTRGPIKEDEVTLFVKNLEHLLKSWNPVARLLEFPNRNS